MKQNSLDTTLNDLRRVSFSFQVERLLIPEVKITFSLNSTLSKMILSDCHVEFSEEGFIKVFSRSNKSALEDASHNRNRLLKMSYRTVDSARPSPDFDSIDERIQKLCL